MPNARACPSLGVQQALTTAASEIQNLLMLIKLIRDNVRWCTSPDAPGVRRPPDRGGSDGLREPVGGGRRDPTRGRDHASRPPLRRGSEGTTAEEALAGAGAGRGLAPNGPRRGRPTRRWPSSTTATLTSRPSSSRRVRSSPTSTPRRGGGSRSGRRHGARPITRIRIRSTGLEGHRIVEASDLLTEEDRLWKDLTASSIRCRSTGSMSRATA